MGTSPKPPRRVGGAMRTLDAYVQPGRRRTDNPLVVGLVVICLSIIAVGTVVQIAATTWAGHQVRTLLDGQSVRDEEVDRVRNRLFKNTEAQGRVLRRICLNFSKDDKEREECLAVGPVLTPTPEVPDKSKRGS